MVMNKKAIITGINGFVGEHVTDAFKAIGFEVIGVGHDDGPNEKVEAKLNYYMPCNLLDVGSVSAIDFTDVAAVVHLAGLSNVGDSFVRPLAYINDNATMTYNLLEQARAQGFGGRFIVVSSGALYNPHQALPITEDSASLENSPYAVGKLAVEHVAKYFKVRGLDVVIARPFNHIGPGQGKGFLVPDLYEQLIQAQTTGTPTISVGNIETRRDYTDVRDIAQAYTLLATVPRLNHELYNICSGKSLAGTEILGILQSLLGTTDITPVVDETKVRPTDIMDIYGDTSLLHADTGWRPTITIEQTLHDFVSRRQ